MVVVLLLSCVNYFWAVSVVERVWTISFSSLLFTLSVCLWVWIRIYFTSFDFGHVCVSARARAFAHIFALMIPSHRIASHRQPFSFCVTYIFWRFDFDLIWFFFIFSCRWKKIYSSSKAIIAKAKYKPPHQVKSNSSNSNNASTETKKKKVKEKHISDNYQNYVYRVNKICSKYQ